MSKTKSRMMQWIDTHSSISDYKKCEKCGEPIATKWSRWKYKYCEACTLQKIWDYKRETGREFKGATRAGQISDDYENGRRWKKDSCDICGFKEALDVHRVIPGCEGGKYTIDNTATLCPNCHALITRKKKKLEFYGKNRVAKLVDL